MDDTDKAGPVAVEEQPVDDYALHGRDLLKNFDELSFRDKWKRVAAGLKQPKESGEHKWARLQMMRLLSPAAAVIVPVLILGLITILAQFTHEPVNTVQVKVVESEPIEELEQILEPEILPPDPFEPTDVQMEISADMPSLPTETVTPPADVASAQPAEFDSVAMVRSPVMMTGIMGSRNPGMRGAALNRYGGKWGDQSHAALLKALKWLKDNQRPDGSWVGQGAAAVPPAMTGLGLLTFLAHGETPASEQFGETVQKAIQYLVTIQNPDGTFKGSEGGLRGGVYSQAIAAYALSEAYAMTRIPMIREPMEKSIQVIIKGQRADGGFDYKFALNDGERIRNTSVAGFQAQALKAASLTGVQIPGLAAAMSKAADGFKLQYPDAKGHFIYGARAGERRAAMTPVGVLCLQLLGHSRSREVRGGIEAMQDWVPDWDKPDMSHGIFEPTYVWYYATQVFFHEGGAVWERWNNLFSPMLIKNQNPDGSWRFGHGRSSAYGPVYHTTLSALMLTVYYRHLPTFMEIQDVELDRERGDDRDIQIEIL